MNPWIWVLLATYGVATAAAYRLAAKVALGSRAETFVLTGIFAHYLLYACWWTVSWGHAFTRFGTTLPPMALCAAILAGVPRTRTFARRVRPQPMARWEWLPAAYGGAAALLAFGASVAEVIAYPTWSWDCVWYHLTQSRLIVQQQTIHFWFGPPDGSGPLFYANGYPRFVETFTAFHLLVLRSEFLVSAAQLPWGLIGAATMAAWGRRLGVSRPTSTLLGASFLLIPAVFLQLHTTHADVATGAQTLALAYFVFAPNLTRASVLTAFVIAAGLVATKMSGILLSALFLPWLFARLAFRWPFRRRGMRNVDAVARRSGLGASSVLRPTSSPIAFGVLTTLSFAIATTRPWLNYQHTKDPFFPATVKLGPIAFEGRLDEEQIAGGKSFLRSPDSLGRVSQMWQAPHGDLFPDVKERPFGATFNFFAVPAAALGLLFSLRRRKRAALALVATIALTMMVPTPWWGRFVLPVPAAMLLLAAIPHSELARFRSFGAAPWAVLRFASAGLFACFLVFDLGTYTLGFRILPPRTVTDLREDLSWLFRGPVIRARNFEVRPGDTVLFDDSVSFQGELWNATTTSHLAYAPSGDVRAFVNAITEAKPRWVVMADREELIRAVEAKGGSRVTQHGFDRTVIYRLP